MHACRQDADTVQTQLEALLTGSVEPYVALWKRQAGPDAVLAALLDWPLVVPYLRQCFVEECWGGGAYVARSLRKRYPVLRPSLGPKVLARACRVLLAAVTRVAPHMLQLLLVLFRVPPTGTAAHVEEATRLRAAAVDALRAVLDVLRQRVPVEGRDGYLWLAPCMVVLWAAVRPPPDQPAPLPQGAPSGPVLPGALWAATH